MKSATKENLAREAIEKFLKNREILKVNPKELDKNLRKKTGCFVTVYIEGELRGCIGNHSPDRPLHKAIIDNVIHAVSADFRFPPVKKSELKKLTLSVTVLTPLKKYKPESSEKLLKFLEKEKPGVLIEKEGRQALFLPQVWEELPCPADFLNELCFKAGLPAFSWQSKTIFWIFFEDKSF